MGFTVQVLDMCAAPGSKTTQLIEALETNWATYAQKAMPREVDGGQ